MAAADRRRSHHCGAPRPAFTLAEVAIALVITSVLLGGLMAALLISSRVLPTDVDRAPGDVADALDRMAAELAYAKTLLIADPTVVEVVYDRGGATVTVRYAWSGVPGDPLRRAENGGPLRDVLAGVEEFDLAYRVRTVTETTTTTDATTSEEGVLASFTDWGGVAGTQQPFALSETRWSAEFFSVSEAVVPPGVSRVRVTRAAVMLRSSVSGAQVTVAIHRAQGGGNPEPANTPIGTPAQIEPTVGATPLWSFVTFSNVQINNFNKELVLVVSGGAGGGTEVEQRNSTSAPSDTTQLVWTTDGGASWDPRKNKRDDNDMPFYVWGTYEATGTTTEETTTSFVTTIGVGVRVGRDTTDRIDTSVATMNEPELPGS